MVYSLGTLQSSNGQANILFFFIIYHEVNFYFLLNIYSSVKQRSSKFLSPEWDIPHRFGSCIWIIGPDNAFIYSRLDNPANHGAVFYFNS